MLSLCIGISIVNEFSTEIGTLASKTLHKDSTSSHNNNNNNPKSSNKGDSVVVQSRQQIPLLLNASEVSNEIIFMISSYNLLCYSMQILLMLMQI